MNIHEGIIVKCAPQVLTMCTVSVNFSSESTVLVNIKENWILIKI